MGNRAARALLPELRFAAEEIRRQARHSESTYPGALHGRTADTIVPEQRDQSVILLNQSERAIALLQVLWQYTLADGRSYLDSIAWVGNKILLLLFHLSEGQKKVFEYWHSIFPDSKRYLAPGGVVVGDNTDVRLPRATKSGTAAMFRVRDHRCRNPAIPCSPSRFLSMARSSWTVSLWERITG